MKRQNAGFKKPFILDKKSMKEFLATHYGYNFGARRFVGSFIFNLRNPELAIKPHNDYSFKLDHADLARTFVNDLEPEFLVGGGLIIVGDSSTGKVKFHVHFHSETLPRPRKEDVKMVKHYIFDLLRSQGFRPKVTLDAKQPVSALIITGTR